MLTVLALSTLTHARIGETVAQCDARYGELKGMSHETTRQYVKSGFAVFATIDKNGKCAAIYYSKMNDEKISTSELKALMRANGTGWVSNDNLGDFKVWVSGDKKAYYRDDDTLTIRTLAYIAAEKAKAEKEEAEKLNAF